MLAIAFLWGASVAVVVSGIVNGLIDVAVGQNWTAMAGAPSSRKRSRRRSWFVSTSPAGTNSTASSTA